MSKPEVVAQLPGRDAEVQAKIDEVRAQREAIAAARAKRAELDEPAAKLAAEQRELANEQAIEAAEQEHGPLDRKIRTVYSDLGVVILKRAHPAAFKRFMDRGKHATKDLEELVRLCLVHPTLSEFENMCAETPFLINRAADAVAWLAGVRTDELSGKS